MVVRPTKHENRGSTLVSAMDEEEMYIETCDSVPKEIENFYSYTSDSDIEKLRLWAESNSTAGNYGLKPGAVAPYFNLLDQDEESVCLRSLLKTGPVVLYFYRGKWDPHSHCDVLKLQAAVEKFEAKGASLVAISPTLPDGTKFLSSKSILGFPVVSDLGSELAQKFNVTFKTDRDYQVMRLKCGLEIPRKSICLNGSLDIPLAATYVVDQTGSVAWRSVSADPGNRVGVDEILDAIPCKEETGNLVNKIPYRRRNISMPNNNKSPRASRPNAFRNLFRRRQTI